MKIEVYHDSKEVCLKSLYCIHSYYRHPSEQCRSGSKLSFPLQLCTILNAKGSTVPVCLEEWPKKHQTWQECVFVEARLQVTKWKRKNYLNRKHCKPHRMAVTQRSKNYEVEFYFLHLINIVKYFTKFNRCNIYNIFLIYFVSSGKHSELKHSPQGQLPQQFSGNSMH